MKKGLLSLGVLLVSVLVLVSCKKEDVAENTPTEIMGKWDQVGTFENETAIATEEMKTYVFFRNFTQAEFADMEIRYEDNTVSCLYKNYGNGTVEFIENSADEANGRKILHYELIGNSRISIVNEEGKTEVFERDDSFAAFDC